MQGARSGGEPLPDGTARSSEAKAHRKAPLRFVVVFVALAASLSLVYLYPYEPGGTAYALQQAYLGAYAHAAGWFIRIFDSTVHVVDRNLVGRFSIQIARDCDAMEATLAPPMARSRSWGRSVMLGAALVAGLAAAALV